MQRRTWLTLALSVLASEVAAEAAPAVASSSAAPAGRPARRARRATRQAAPTPPPPAAEPGILPPIDTPAVQPVGPGLLPAPVPNSNVQPPLNDREPHPTVNLGVPTPPLFGQGETFRHADSVNEDTRPGLRLPSPGATIRLPIW
jgi:hypothetical protein